MNTLTLRPLAMRFTEISASGVLGSSIVRKQVFDISLRPVIETGKTYRSPPEGKPLSSYRTPDKFKHFELKLRDRRRFRWDRELKRMLGQAIALEFWTENSVDPCPWIHWAFPLTSWKKVGRGRYEGRSKHHGCASGLDFGAPDEAEISDGGWWYTMIPPPAS